LTKFKIALHFYVGLLFFVEKIAFTFTPVIQQTGFYFQVPSENSYIAFNFYVCSRLKQQKLFIFNIQNLSPAYDQQNRCHFQTSEFLS